MPHLEGGSRWRADAARWVAAVGRMLAAGEIKTDRARELRLIGKDWATVHAGRLAAQEFERLRARVEQPEGGREPWREQAHHRR